DPRVHRPFDPRRERRRRVGHFDLVEQLDRRFDLDREFGDRAPFESLANDRARWTETDVDVSEEAAASRRVVALPVLPAAGSTRRLRWTASSVTDRASATTSGDLR